MLSEQHKTELQLYATPVWWRFVNAGNRNRLETFLRWAGKSGYYSKDSLPRRADLCEQADEQLFYSVKHTPTHPLHRLLPPSTVHFTCAHVHNYKLSSKITSIDECHFIYHVLYKDCFFSFLAYDIRN